MKRSQLFCLYLIFVFLPFWLCPMGLVSALELSNEEQDYLLKKKTIAFVSQTHYPPFEFAVKEGGHDGMCIELARWMATEIGFTARFTDTYFQEAQKAVLFGKADVLTSLFYSKNRDDSFEFTQPMFEVPASIFVVAERTDIKNIGDLNGKTIAMQKGDYAKEYLESKKISFELVNTENFATAADLVIAGKADAVIGDEQIVLYHVFKNRLTEKIKKVGDPLYIGKNCMAVMEGNSVLIGILTKGITLAQRKGILDKINKKWIGTHYSIGESPILSYIPHILISTIVLLMALLSVWFWNMKLRQEVSKRTKALKKSEQRYRSLFEESRDAISVHSRNGEFLDVNQAMLELFGYTKEEMIGTNVSKIYANPKDGRNVLSLLERGPIRDYEIKGKKKNGDEMDCLLTATARWEDDGTIVGYQGLIRDVTEKRKLEAQLQRAQKMEAVGTLAGGVAHDLNNILSGITSIPDLLLMQLPQDSPLRKPIATMELSGMRAAAVVQDLLTMARRGVPTMGVVNLNDIISDYLQSPEYSKLKSFFPGVEVKTDLAGSLLNISGSLVHLSKTVMNLLFNAAEAMPNGGTIQVSTQNQYIDMPVKGYDDVEEGDYAVLTVSDGGLGISPQDIDRIFEPFYTKKKMGRSGSGLGLAVVWGTVKDHKGYIDIQSIEKKGTSFTLYFPVCREKPAERKSSVPVEDCKGRGESILVVDDVYEQREIASNILIELGYNVVTASSGEEAVDFMKENSIDLIVLDMIMEPGIDGLDTYKKILEDHPGQKAVIASGFSETDRVIEAQRLGAGPYIKKPYTFVKIGTVVRKELDR
jgi:two-component system, cell cycle sensor histidine kinase and response regulator CckA